MPSKDPQTKMRSKLKLKSIPHFLTFRNKFMILGFALYITFIILSRVPLIAEPSVRQAMDDKYDYHLEFPSDGNLSHYYVERENTNLKGEIILTYWTTTHTLNVDSRNIKNLSVDCKSIYDDESMKVFKTDPTTDANYYKNYFIDKDKFLIHVTSTNAISELRFKYAPEPVLVYVDGAEWWKTNMNYAYEGQDVIVTNVSAGNTNIILFFKESLKPQALFSIKGSNIYVENLKVYGYMNKDITFDASDSNDDADGGIIDSYSWDFGDGLFGSGEIVNHKFTSTGEFTVTLTVTDDQALFDTHPQSITIVVQSNDEDEDGMDDTWEVNNGLDPTQDDSLEDADLDELDNLEEFLHQTDPQEFDSDGDLLPDGWEVTSQLDPLDPTGDNGSDGDPDGDDFTNLAEFEEGTDPMDKKSNPDESGDGDKKDDESDMFGIYAGIIVVIIIVIILVVSYIMSAGRSRREDKEPPEGPETPDLDDELSADTGGDTGEDYEVEDEEEYDYEYDEEFEPDEGFEDFEEELELPEAEILEEEIGPAITIKPEVRTIEKEDRMEVIELGIVHPCSLCSVEMPIGKRVFQCTCGLLTHKDCISSLDTCPQCGRELDLEPLGISPTPLETEKKIKKPLIHKEMKKEIMAKEPPGAAFFVFIPKKTDEQKIVNFIEKYLNNRDVGKAVKFDELKNIRYLICVDCAQQMIDHCYEKGRKKEVMGLMIGQIFQYKDETYSIVKDIVSSELDATEVNVKFDSFDELFDQLDQLDYEYQIIGWYHSHPDYTSFMSPTDVDTQARMFKLPYQFALVIDPIQFDMNAFTLNQDNPKKVIEKGFAIVEIDK